MIGATGAVARGSPSIDGLDHQTGRGACPAVSALPRTTAAELYRGVPVIAGSPPSVVPVMYRIYLAAVFFAVTGIAFTLMVALDRLIGG